MLFTILSLLFMYVVVIAPCRCTARHHFCMEIVFLSLSCPLVSLRFLTTTLLCLSTSYVSSQRSVSVFAVVGTTSERHLQENVQGICGEALTKEELMFLRSGTVIGNRNDNGTVIGNGEEMDKDFH